MRLGVHTKPMGLQRLYAESRGWGAVQTHYGNPQSYATYRSKGGVVGCINSVYYAWHAAYVVSINPRSEFRGKTGEYLRTVIQQAKDLSIDTIVVHNGSVTGRDPRLIKAEIDEFVKSEGLDMSRVSIELLAANEWANREPIPIIKAYGWCLDLAHMYASGVGFEGIRELISAYKPNICHCNFPGSEWGSGRDVHGWRHSPQLIKRGNRIESRDNGVEALCRQFDLTIRLLAQLDVPMIVEGSGFVGSMDQELELIRSIAVV